MGDREDFLAWVNSRLKDAEVALHNGDAEPRRAIWTHGEPVTVFGAWRNVNGQDEVAGLFSRLAAAFSDCTSYTHEVIAADVVGDMAYTVGYERTHVSIDGEPREYTLRATQIYRREDGEWKVVHRHADSLVELNRPEVSVS